MTAAPPKLVAAGRSAAAPPLLLVVLVGLTFFRTLGFAFVWDDWLVLIHNPRLNPPTLAGAGYYWTHVAWNLYMPIAMAGWALLAALATPLNPAIFHAANVALQALVVLGVYRLLRRIIVRPWPAAAGAALFAVHPVQVEVVCFVGALNTLLCAALALPALCDSLDAAEQPARANRLLARSTVLVCAATLCKPIAVVVPLFAVVLDRAVRRRPWRAVVRSTLPLIGAVVPCLLWTKLLQPPRPVAAAAVPIWFRPLVAADTVAQYVRLILWPVHLCVDYGRSPAWLYQHPLHATDGLITLMLILLAISLRRRVPLLAAAIAVFVIGFLPVSGLASFDFQQYSTIGDRYAYLPMLGPALAFAWLLSRPAVLEHARLTAWAVAVFVIGLHVASTAQTSVWESDRTLFTRVVTVNPRSWLGHNNLGVALLRTSPAQAAIEARQAIGFDPHNPVGYETLCKALLARRDAPAAVLAARSGTAEDRTDVELQRLLAIALDQAGDTGGAITAYTQYLSNDPADSAAETNLAADLAQSGKLAQAQQHYRRAQQLDPHSTVAAAGLARIQRQSGNR